MKKLFALMICLMLACACSCTALAAPDMLTVDELIAFCGDKRYVRFARHSLS